MSDMWGKIQQGAKDAKQKAEEKLKQAQESELWQKTQENAREAGRTIKTTTNDTWNKARDAVQGKRHEVVFLAPTLGMTLARQEGTGKAIISRVDETGPAAAAGVEVGMLVMGIRAGRPGDSSTEPTIAITSYDQLMGLFPAMGRPVTMTFLKPNQQGPMPTGGVFGFEMNEEIAKATRIMQVLTTQTQFNPDHMIPKQILQDAKGIAFIRTAKIGLGLSVKGGTGIVIARLGEQQNQWSAPCAIGVGSLGWGFQLGVELTDIMIILNTYEAVEAFASGKQVSLGGDVGVALGPVGRTGGITANVHGGRLSQGEEVPVRIAPSYSYSHSKGAFIGVSLEGGLIQPRNDLNERYYDRRVSARELLSGMIQPPDAASDLYHELAMILSDGEQPRYVPQAQPSNPQPATGDANPFSEAPTTAAEAAAAATVANSGTPTSGDEPEFAPLSSKSDDL